MGAVRIHRGDPAHFIKVPNATARDPRLSWAARGYLAEMLSNKPDWDPETTEAAARRAKRERGTAGESARAVRAIHAELERGGHRHRLRWSSRENQGRWVNETHYYAEPTVPCPDALTCANCVSPGRTGCAETSTRSDQAQQGISPGRTEWTLTEGSVNRGVGKRGGLPEDDLTEDDLPEISKDEEDAGSAGAGSAGTPPATPPARADARLIDSQISQVEDNLFSLRDGEYAAVHAMLSRGYHPNRVTNTIQRKRDEARAEAEALARWRKSEELAEEEERAAEQAARDANEAAKGIVIVAVAARLFPDWNLPAWWAAALGRVFVDEPDLARLARFLLRAYLAGEEDVDDLCRAVRDRRYVDAGPVRDAAASCELVPAVAARCDELAGRAAREAGPGMTLADVIKAGQAVAAGMARPPDPDGDDGPPISAITGQPVKPYERRILCEICGQTHDPAACLPGTDPPGPKYPGCCGGTTGHVIGCQAVGGPVTAP